MYHTDAIDLNCDRRNPLLLTNKQEIKETIFFENDTLYFCNLIFSEQEKIKLHSCENLNICFNNCIILRHICLESVPKSISFDNCYFRKLSIYCSYPNVFINSCIIDSLSINGYQNNLDLWNSEIYFLGIYDCLNSSEFDISGNIIHRFRINNIQNIKNFTYQQFSCFQNSLSSFSRNLKKIISYSTKENINTQLYTLNFIESLDCINEDSKLCTEIDFLKIKLLPRNWFQKLILNLCGFFMNPGQIVLEIFTTIIFFAILLYFIKGRDFSLLHYLEQSFNSFFCSNADNMSFFEKILCYSETVLGFLEMNIFTIALAKKYLK